jgi:hypothetical protein
MFTAGVANCLLTGTPIKSSVKKSSKIDGSHAFWFLLEFLTDGNIIKTSNNLVLLLLFRLPLLQVRLRI